MSPKFLIASAGLLAALSAQAAVSVTGPTFTYTQSFDSLAASGTANPWVNDSTLQGWSLFNGTAALTSYRASTGTDTTGAAYSFGLAADRALGSIASGSLASPTLALALTNNTGFALDSFTLRFDGEQWRNGGNTAVQQLTVQYGFGSSFTGVTTWINAGAAFDVKSLVNTATAAAVNGNVAGLSANLGGTISTNWAAGDTLWIRWNDVNDAGNDHGLAIDNVSLSVTAAVPEPGSYAMLLAGLGAVGFIARRRRG
ncbi:MAG: PEP-CTERM sorting domain-containing protein [Comamonadaceae bacterium]|nr:PEP-CTERM sorting domain-containing protein [Comamonadaceae bacterium]